MPSWNSCKPALDAEAVVHRVDPISRELTALIEGRLVNVYVPPDCDVFLRGERIKLRIVQPRDRVRVTLAALADSLIARVVEVQPGCSSGTPSR
jgi:hypothetical protein